MTAATPRGVPHPPAAPGAAKTAWDFGRGDEITPHRTMQALLGGGERYEACVAWNHRLMTRPC